jgi:FtsH-binding integral membrane protein
MFNSDLSGGAALPSRIDLSEIMRRVYSWVCAGLVVCFAIAYFVGQTIINYLNTGQNATLAEFFINPIVYIGSIVLYFVVAFTLYPVIQRATLAVGTLMYLLFTALFGFVISTVLVSYSIPSIATAFVTAAAMFGIMSIIGFTTKVDLSKFGPVLFMALIGLIIGSLVNIFFLPGAGWLYWGLTYLGVIIFAGLVAYDTQWIARNAATIAEKGDEQAAGKIALIGAFRLFMDFVNLFLYLLRIFGRSR